MQVERYSKRLLSGQRQALTALTLTMILSIVWLYMVQFGYAQSDNMNTNAQTQNDNNGLSLPELIISPSLTSTYRDSIGNLHIVGEVHNNFTFSIEFVRIIATLYNDNKEVITMGNTFTNMGQIKPGENTGFDLVVTDPPQNISSYTISGSYERTHISKPEFLSLTVGSYYLDAGGHYHLTGKITNEGSAPTKFVKAAGVFFDVNKKIVDVGSEYTMPTDLQPIYSTIFL